MIVATHDSKLIRIKLQQNIAGIQKATRNGISADRSNGDAHLFWIGLELHDLFFRGLVPRKLNSTHPSGVPPQAFLSGIQVWPSQVRMCTIAFLVTTSISSS